MKKKEKKQKRVRVKPTPEQRAAIRARRRRTARELLLDAVFYLAGCFLYACSVNIFTAPNDIAPGGVTGIATMLNHLFDLPIGVTMWVINVPLFVAAWIWLGRGFTVRTLIATTISSALIDVNALWMPAFTPGDGNLILVSLFGGVVAGLGLALIYMRSATTGGTEIMARLLERKFRHIPIGRLLFIVDAVVVAASIIVYGNVQTPLYAVIVIFVTGLIIDHIIYGADAGKMMMIVSAHYEEVSAAIMGEMDRGVTHLQARGGYTGEERPVLLCAVRKTEAYRLRRLVYRIDPAAFIVVLSTDEVLGEGFKDSHKE